MREVHTIFPFWQMVEMTGSSIILTESTITHSYKDNNACVGGGIVGMYRCVYECINCVFTMPVMVLYYIYVTVHTKRVIFTYLMENEFLISFESLDTATSNSASSGFISVYILKLEQL